MDKRDQEDGFNEPGPMDSEGISSPEPKPKPPGGAQLAAVGLARIREFFRDPARPLWQRVGAAVAIAFLVGYPFAGGPKSKQRVQQFSDESFPSGDANLNDSTAEMDHLRVQARELSQITAERKEERESPREQPEAAPAASGATSDADPLADKVREYEPPRKSPDAESTREYGVERLVEEPAPAAVKSSVQTPFQSLAEISPHPVALAATKEGIWIAEHDSVMVLKDGDPKQISVRLEPKSYETQFNDDLTRISAFLPTESGDLWVGFLRGQIMRFDKYGWKILVRPGDQLKSSVASLSEFKGEVRAASRGLWKWSEAVQRLVPTKTFEPRLMTNLTVTKQGQLLAAGEEGIWIFDAEQRSWRQFWKTAEGDIAVYAMTTGADGMLYAGTKNGIVAISPNGVVTERMLPGEHIDAIAIDADSHLWAGTRGKGLRYFNGQLWHLAGVEEGLSNRITTILIDARDRMWLGSDQNGLLVADRAGVVQWIGKFAEIAPDANEPKIFPDACDAAAALLKGVSLSGNIAVDTFDGRTIVFFDGVQRCPKGIGYRRADGAALLKTDWTVSVFRNGQRSSVEIPKEFAADTVTTAILDSRDKIWLGTSMQGVYRYAGEKWEAFGAAEGFENNAVTSMFEDGSGTVWVGSMPTYDKAAASYSGANLHALSPNGWVHLTPKEGLGSWLTLGMTMLKNSDLLLATSNGFSIINGKGEIANYSKKDGLNPNYAFSVSLDGRGRIWIAHQYFGDGVTWFDGQQFFRLNQETKIFNSRISAIAHDRLGRVWLTASNGAVGIYPMQYFDDNAVAVDVRKGRPRALTQ